MTAPAGRLIASAPLSAAARRRVIAGLEAEAAERRGWEREARAAGKEHLARSFAEQAARREREIEWNKRMLQEQES